VSSLADSSQPEPVEYVHRSWPADPEQLALIRREVRRWLTPLDMDDDEVADLVLAVDEAATNAIEHAYRHGEHGNVELLLWTEPNLLCIEVVDQGTWKPPSATTTTRGRGIQAMHSVTDSVMIHHDQRGTRVLLRRKLPDQASQPFE
jgi:serine/threonine-protein kinase RsbW